MPPCFHVPALNPIPQRREGTDRLKMSSQVTLDPPSAARHCQLGNPFPVGKAEIATFRSCHINNHYGMTRVSEDNLGEGAGKWWLEPLPCSWRLQAMGFHGLPSTQSFEESFSRFLSKNFVPPEFFADSMKLTMSILEAMVPLCFASMRWWRQDLSSVLALNHTTHMGPLVSFHTIHHHEPLYFATR